MNQAALQCPPLPINLHRPWWSRALDELRTARERRRLRDAERDVYNALGHLSEGTLRDIGAPEWLHECDRDAHLLALERFHW